MKIYNTKSQTNPESTLDLCGSGDKIKHDDITKIKNYTDQLDGVTDWYPDTGVGFP